MLYSTPAGALVPWLKYIRRDGEKLVLSIRPGSKKGCSLINEPSKLLEPFLRDLNEFRIAEGDAELVLAVLGNIVLG